MALLKRKVQSEDGCGSYTMATFKLPVIVCACLLLLGSVPCFAKTSERAQEKNDCSTLDHPDVEEILTEADENDVLKENACSAPDVDEIKGCKGCLDLVFLVDSSSSMIELSPFEDPLFAWRSHQTFMKQIVSKLPVGSQSRVGLVTYSNAPKLNFHLQQHSTSNDVQDAIMSASFLGGNTNNAAALRMVQDDTVLQFRSSTAVRKVVVIFTDGLANLEFAKTEQEAQSLHDRGTEVFVIAVTHEIYYEVLYFMASSPKDKHIINVNGIKELDERLALILAHRICGVEDPITTEPPPTCLPNCVVCQGDVCVLCMEGFYEKDNKCKGDRLRSGQRAFL